MRNEIKLENAVSVGPYSQAIDAGLLIFLSGQTPLDPNTMQLVKGGIEKQTKQCFENLFRVLNKAELTPDCVVKVNVYLTSMDDFNQMNKVYETMFNKPYPARTTVAVKELPMGANVEIEMIARKS